MPTWATLHNACLVSPPAGAADTPTTRRGWGAILGFTMSFLLMGLALVDLRPPAPLNPVLTKTSNQR
jgi:hypothetical protein